MTTRYIEEKSKSSVHGSRFKSWQKSWCSKKIQIFFVLLATKFNSSQRKSINTQSYSSMGVSRCSSFSNHQKDITISLMDMKTTGKNQKFRKVQESVGAN